MIRLIALFMALTTVAYAQTIPTPGKSYRNPNQSAPVAGLTDIIPLFGSKVDVTNGTITTPTVTGGVFTGGNVSGMMVTPTGGTPAALSSYISGAAAMGGLKVGPAARQNIYADYGSVVVRINDRLFVGGATVNSGTYNTPTKDWMEELIPNTTGIAQFASSGTIGNIGVLGGSRASDSVSGITNNIATAGVSYLNIENPAQVVWAIYGETRRSLGARGVAQANEFDIINAAGGDVGSADPYNPFNNVKSINTWLSSGRPDTPSGDATVALGIINNAGTAYATGGRYKVGIMFDAHSIMGTDGLTGYGTAIQLAKGHQVQWYAGTNIPTGGIASSATGTADATFIDMSPIGFAVTQGNAGALLTVIPAVAGATSFIQINASVGGTVSVASGGVAADLLLQPGSNKVLVLGGLSATGATAGALVLPSAPARFKKIKDQTDGQTYLIPLYNP